MSFCHPCLVSLLQIDLYAIPYFIVVYISARDLQFIYMVSLYPMLTLCRGMVPKVVLLCSAGLHTHLPTYHYSLWYVVPWTLTEVGTIYMYAQCTTRLSIGTVSYLYTYCLGK